MTTAETLLELQRLDLALERDEVSLRELPELKELARKRAAYQKLKAEAAHLMGTRKDLETEVADLTREQAETEHEVTLTQEDAQRLKDYREVQALEIELSDLAKKLDKIAFNLKEKESALADALEREEKVNAYLAKFEQALLNDAQATRAAVTAVQERIDAARRDRNRTAASLDATMLDSYEASRKAHKGIGVEELRKNVPSVCRMALTEASMEDVTRAGSIATCPYCGRILIQQEVTEA